MAGNDHRGPSSIGAVVSVALLAAAGSLGSAAGAESVWRQIQSPHFVFIGDTTEAKLRKVARNMERFYEGYVAFWGQLPGKPVPCTVLVFEREKEFRATMPLVDGRPRAGDAIFVRGFDKATIVLSLSARDVEAATHHETVHYFLSSLLRPAPLWLEEGLAELLATMEFGEGTVTIGRSTRERTAYVRYNKIKPIESIFAVHRTSPEYVEAKRAVPFYAECWAFLHFMLCGHASGNPEGFVRFLELTGDGNYTPEKFETAFGCDYRTFDSKLRDYMEHGRYVTRTVPVPGTIADAALACRALTSAERDCHLGDLLARLQRLLEAELHLTRAAVALPQDPRPRESLGLVALFRDDSTAAAERYAEACALGSRNPMALTVTAQRRLEEALIGLGGEATLPWGEYEEITKSFKISINGSPTFSAPYESLAHAVCLAEKALADDAEWLQQALRVLPESRTVLLALAFTHLRTGNRDHASALVAKLTEPDLNPPLRPRLRLLQQMLAP